MASHDGRRDSGGRVGHRDGCDVGDRARFWRNCSAAVHRLWQPFLPKKLERTDRFVDRANLQLCNFAVRRVALSGVGGHNRLDDADSEHQSGGALSDAQEILIQDMSTPTPTHKGALPARVPKIATSGL